MCIVMYFSTGQHSHSVLHSIGVRHLLLPEFLLLPGKEKQVFPVEANFAGLVSPPVWICLEPGQPSVPSTAVPQEGSVLLRSLIPA